MPIRSFGGVSEFLTEVKVDGASQGVYTQDDDEVYDILTSINGSADISYTGQNSTSTPQFNSDDIVLDTGADTPPFYDIDIELEFSPDDNFAQSANIGYYNGGGGMVEIEHIDQGDRDNDGASYRVDNRHYDVFDDYDRTGLYVEIFPAGSIEGTMSWATGFEATMGNVTVSVDSVNTS